MEESYGGKEIGKFLGSPVLLYVFLFNGRRNGKFSKNYCNSKKKLKIFEKLL